MFSQTNVTTDRPPPTHPKANPIKKFYQSLAIKISSTFGCWNVHRIYLPFNIRRWEEALKQIKAALLKAPLVIACFIIYWHTFQSSTCYVGSRNEWKLLGPHHNLLVRRLLFYSHSFSLISRRKLCLSSYQLVYSGWFSAVKINIFESTDCPIQWFIKGDTISTKPFVKIHIPKAFRRPTLFTQLRFEAMKANQFSDHVWIVEEKSGELWFCSLQILLWWSEAIIFLQQCRNVYEWVMLWSLKLFMTFIFRAMNEERADWTITDNLI